ncbi:MAG: hypothetical protein KDK70_32745, partial [Myxococcales bacterium]|nr:hypothetical protein [Myxococcales bacterium]
MLSLPQVLYEAQRHAVEEIAIEPGEPVSFHGQQGALVLGDPLEDADISEALSQVLAPEQQAELAVAGVVEFYVEGYAQWSLVAETAEDGVVIRGHVRDGDSPSEVGTPLELPPLQPFQPERGADPPPSSGSVLRRSVRQATRWDMGIADVLDLDDEEDSAEPVFDDSGSRAMLDDDEAIDFALVGRTGPEALP